MTMPLPFFIWFCLNATAPDGISYLYLLIGVSVIGKLLCSKDKTDEAADTCCDKDSGFSHGSVSEHKYCRKSESSRAAADRRSENVNGLEEEVEEYHCNDNTEYGENGAEENSGIHIRI